MGLFTAKTASILWLALTLTLSGCASSLYGNLQEKDLPRCQSDPECRYSTAQTAKKGEGALAYRILTMYQTKRDAPLLELTPLGILAPLFGYPQARVPDVYQGEFSPRFLPPEAVNEPIRKFDISEGASASFSFDFNSEFSVRLHREGSAIKYSPDKLTVAITCSKGNCKLQASPEIIRADGSVILESESVTDNKRIEEIRMEATQAREKQDAAARRQEAAMRLRRKAQSDQCPAIMTALREHQRVYSGRILDPDGPIVKRGAQLMDKFNSLDCSGWVARKMGY